MNKQILLILLLLAYRFSFAQLTVTIHWYEGSPANNGDTIYYDPGQKLGWNDFTGQPDYNSMAAAITESGFGYRMAMRSVNSRINLVITIFCYFNKKKSWVKEDMNTHYALAHEQNHFNITYINTCMFVKKLKGASFSAGNYDRLVNSIYDECYEALRKMQDQYDGQTANGRIKGMQTMWNKKVDNMLAEFVIN